MQTLVAAFRDTGSAQRALDSLVQNGFGRGSVHLQSGYGGDDGTSDATTSSGDGDTPHRQGFFAGVEHFFSNLFNDDADAEQSAHAGRYVDAVRRGNSVVAVDTRSDEEADKATSLLYDLGATDVDDQDGDGDPSMASTNAGRDTYGSAYGDAGSTGARGMGDASMDDIAATAPGGTSMLDAAPMGTMPIGTAPMSTASMGAVVNDDAMGNGAVDRASMNKVGDASPGDRSAMRSTDYPSTDRGATAVDDQAVMPIVQEELQVGKRMVQGGGIRVVRRITETPVSEMVTLREERAVVERRPVMRTATEADFGNFQEGTIEVRERAEEAVVGKTAHVVEEVVIGKQVTERSETVSDTVRRTDVDVETIAPDSTTKRPTGLDRIGE